MADYSNIPDSNAPAPDDAAGWSELLLGQRNNKLNQNKLFGLAGLGEGGRYEANMAAKYMIPAEYWGLAQQMGLYNQLLPDQLKNIQEQLNYLQHPELASDAYRQQMQGQALTNTQQGLNSLAASGAGQGTREGLALHDQNAANRNAAAFDANIFSPQGRIQSQQAANSLFASLAPNYDRLGALNAIQVGTPRNASGLQALGQIAGGALSSWAGGGFGGIGGAAAGAAGGAAGAGGGFVGQGPGPWAGGYVPYGGSNQNNSLNGWGSFGGFGG